MIVCLGISDRQSGERVNYYLLRAVGEFQVGDVRGAITTRTKYPFSDNASCVSCPMQKREPDSTRHGKKRSWVVGWVGRGDGGACEGEMMMVVEAE